jgi:hypothetical protein
MRLLAKRERLRLQPRVQLDRLALVVCLQLAVALVVGCGRVPPVGTAQSPPPQRDIASSSRASPIGIASPSPLPTVATSAGTDSSCNPAAGTLAPRGASSLAYDPLSGKILLFGGTQTLESTSTDLADTWAWTGTCWTQLHPAHHPSSRAWAPMAFDYQANRMLLYGGGFCLAICNRSDAAWSWDGSDWQPVTAVDDGLPAGDFLMASAPKLGMFKIGYGDSQVPITHVGTTYLFGTAAAYRWSGSRWVRSSSDGPVTGAGASFSYDPNLGAFLLFGGSWNGSPPQACGWGPTELWATDGKSWTHVNQGAAQPCGGGGAMAYDPTLNSMIWVGSDGTWAWDEKQWTHLATAAQSPPWGPFALLAYDPDHHQLLLRGMLTGEGLGHTYAWDGTTWTAP